MSRLARTLEPKHVIAWLSSLFARFQQAFGIDNENYKDLKARNDAISILSIATLCAVVWFCYGCLYFALGSTKMAALCLFGGFPSAVLALWVLKFYRQVYLSSFIANVGGGTVLLLCMLLSGGAWSHQILWCMVAIVSIFIVQTPVVGMLMAFYVSAGATWISLSSKPGVQGIQYWDFPFAFLSDQHIFFNALTMASSTLLVAACTYIIKSRQEKALHESELLRVEAELERQKAEILSEQVKEHVRDIHAMLQHAKFGLFSVRQDLSIHKDYARYLESIVEDDNLAGRDITDVLLSHTDLNSEEKAKVLTAMEYTLGEDEAFFEANASVLPRKCVIKFGSKRQKALEIDWAPVSNSAGEVEKILISLFDISETLEQEVLLEKQISEKTQRLEVEMRLATAASIAHRLNNPINFISLGATSVSENLQAIKQALEALFGTDSIDDPEILACRQNFAQILQKFEEPLSDISIGTRRAADFVEEIRALSGLGGSSFADLNSYEFVAMTHKRLQENLGFDRFQRLRFDVSILSPSIRGSKAILLSAIETFYSVSLNVSQGELSTYLIISSPTECELEVNSNFLADQTMAKALERCLQSMLQQSGGEAELLYQPNRMHLKLAFSAKVS